MTNFQFGGLNLALTTPFDSEGRVDLGRLEAHIERYIAAGVRGFVLSSGTGMHVYLSREESDALVARGAKIIAGRARVIVQTSALLVEDVVDRTKHAADCGADGVMVLPPFFEGPTDDDGVFDFYAAASRGGLPIIGYNVPQAVGVGISPNLLVRLSEIPNFLTVKDSSGDFAAQTDLIGTGVPVMNGADPLTPYALFAGVSGLIWGGANFAPRTAVALVEAAKQGHWAQVRDIWKTLQPIMNLIWQGDYVQKVYAAAKLMGFDAGDPRRPLKALSRDKVDAVNRALGLLSQRERDAA